ncbi:MAG: hypothetical protein EBZ36_10955 [Acidobacteria bacterium]|nr:hypothetical protein [Acidobacteriota bacterium]
MIGRFLIRSPVAAKMALLIAGRIGGSAGSPSPVGGFGDFRVHDHRSIVEGATGEDMATATAPGDATP